MITLRKSDIPEYLQRGEMYRTLVENDENPDEELTFPKNVLKPDVSVNSLDDCDLLLNSVRFWGVPNFVSVEMITFILHDSHSNNISVLEKYGTEFPFVQGLHRVAAVYHLDKVQCAIESGVAQLVAGVVDCFSHLVPVNACEIAAAVGSVEILAYLRVRGCKWNNAGDIAAYHGHVTILRYLVEQGNELCSQELISAVMGGHVECIRYIHTLLGDETLYYKDAMIVAATRCGHVNVLQYISDNYHTEWQYYQSCDAAAIYGHLDCLVFLHERGCGWDEDTCSNAARNGHSACLQYLHEQGCPWDVCTSRTAADGGHLQCLQYAYENGCPCDEHTCAGASSGNHLLCLRYLHENGCPWNESTCVSAAMRGNVECLQYAHEHGCVWNKEVCRWAAENGRLHCLQYAHENGCDWDVQTTLSAIKNGSLQCLEYARENGCPLPEEVRIESYNRCYTLLCEWGVRAVRLYSDSP